MATEIIRPDSTSANSNFTFTSGTLHGNLSDQDTGTVITQDNVSAAFTVGCSDLSVSCATISSVTIYMSAQTSGRAGSAEINIGITLGGSINLADFTFGTDMVSNSSSARTTDASGDAITLDQINAMTIVCTPNEAGIIVSELWASISYTECPTTTTYDNTVNHLKIEETGHINITSGNIFI
jgi:hypothetical protein